VNDPTASKVPGYMDTNDIAAIADTQAAAAIAALGALGDVRFDGLTTTPGHVAVFTSADGKLIEDGGAIPAGTGDMFGTASATDGNLMVFDVDGYHAKDGGAASVAPIIKTLTTQFDKTNNTPTSIADLSIDVVAGSQYIFKGVFPSLGEGAAGVRFGLNGTCTYSAFLVTALTVYGVAPYSAAAYESDFSDSVLSTDEAPQYLTMLDGSITVTGNGAIYPMFAQSNTNVLPSSVLVGSFFKVEKVV
jgi:hypothetical protein